MPAPGVEESPGLEDARRPVPIRPAPSPAQILRGRALFLAVLATAGALLASLAGALLPARYRATASLLVAEPRLGSPGSVDFNLTPIRSYAALAGSRALAEPCRAALGRDVTARVRVPEYTRLLEIAADDRDPQAAATFVNCLAERATAENRRLNAALAASSAAPAAAALEAARGELRESERRMAELRSETGLEARRAALRVTADAVAAAAEEESRALLAAEDASAREGSFPAGSASPDRSAASAEAAGARARARAAAGQRQAAERRLGVLEREVAAAEQRLEVHRRALMQSEAAVNELAKRSALAPVDAAAKGFELVLVSPATAPERPTRPPLPLFAAAGAAAALALGILLALSRP